MFYLETGWFVLIWVEAVPGLIAGLLSVTKVAEDDWLRLYFKIFILGRFLCIWEWCLLVVYFLTGEDDDEKAFIMQVLSLEIKIEKLKGT